MQISTWAAARGFWTPDLAPWLAGILDAAAEPDIETIVVRGDPQVGKTTALLALAAWYAQHDAEPVEYLAPSQEMARWAIDHRLPQVKADPLFYGASALTAVDVRRPVRAMLCDDVERYPRLIPDEFVTDARRRTMTFLQGVVVLAGNSPLTQHWYDRSDQREYREATGWQPTCKSMRIAGFDLSGPDFRMGNR